MFTDNTFIQIATMTYNGIVYSLQAVLEQETEQYIVELIVGTAPSDSATKRIGEATVSYAQKAGVFVTTYQQALAYVKDTLNNVMAVYVWGTNPTPAPVNDQQAWQQGFEKGITTLAFDTTGAYPQVKLP